MTPISLYSVVYEDGTRIFRPSKATARELYRQSEDWFFRQVEQGQPAVRPVGIDRHHFPNLTKAQLCHIFTSDNPMEAMMRIAQTSVVMEV